LNPAYEAEHSEEFKNSHKDIDNSILVPGRSQFYFALTEENLNVISSRFVSEFKFSNTFF
jgi:hypothetical protein